MKNQISRIVHLCAILVILLSFIACQGPAGQNGLDGKINVNSVLVENVPIVVGVNVIDLPELTQEILNNGLIQVYYKNRTAIVDIWNELPFSPEGNLALELSSFRIGKVVIHSINLDQNLDFRIVLISE
jgi:hypothetical protein